MEIVKEFKALSDKTRLRILGLLLIKNLCVCEIIDILKMTQPRISRHMGILKYAGFVEEERKGKWIIYKIINKSSSILSYVQKKLKDYPEHRADVLKIKNTSRKKLCPMKD